MWRYQVKFNKGGVELTLQVITLMAASLITGPVAWAAASSLQCTGTAAATSFLLTDWEAGLGPWEVGTYEVARPATFDTPDWAVVSNLPGGRSGSAAFVANLNTGDCGADDESGALTLTSPEIEIPANSSGPQISFNHWFHIEYGWDGGNLKISVNGGPYQLVPASAFQAGPYTDTLFDAFDSDGISYNTNPLAEQEAFTGPAGQQVTGSWRESRVDLSGIAGPGDTIRLQFDFGVDACDGQVGWYVDEVEVYGCVEELPAEETSLTLVNQVLNDSGGSAPPSAWTLTATGPTGFSGLGPSVSSGSDFQPGTYDLSQSGGPAGYAASAWVCSEGTQVDADTITLEAGANATCTITNDDIAPTLQLVKTIVNDNGGTVTNPNDFGLRIDGDLVANKSKYALSVGSHQASEDGLAGYRPGPWGGDCAADGSITLVLGQAATCTITNNDVDPGFQINAGHSGAWFNPDTAGQGQLIDVEPGQQFMFISWFTYTDAASANPSEQRWLTAQGNYSGKVAHLVLHETLGGQFDDPQEVSIEPVGEVILEFDDCEQGRMAYLIDAEDLAGEFPLVRAIPGSGNVCASQADNRPQAVEINAGMDGAWFDVNTPGQGFLVDTHIDQEGENFIFVAWFTYGDETASGQRWLTAQGGFEGSLAEIDVYETTGGSFDDPQVPSIVPVGTMSLDFSDCSHAHVTYSLPREGREGEIDITRAVPGSEALCEEIAGAD